MMDLNHFLDRSGSGLGETSFAPSLAPSFDEDASSQEDLDISTISPVEESKGEARGKTASYSNTIIQSFQSADSEQQQAITVPEDEQSQSSVQSETLLQDYQEQSLDDQKAEEVRSVFADPNMWRYLDHFQIECFGMGDCFDASLPSMRMHREDPWTWFQQEEEKDNDVVMKVEATALSENDVYLEMHLRPHDAVPGSNAVGVVHHCRSSAEEAGVKPGMRIATILRHGGSNARYLSLPASEVLPVPRHLDACDVACVITTYLPAFQALHHGRDRPGRYSRNSFEGCNVLITGGEQLIAQATVRLAQLAGAKHVYISGPSSLKSSLQKHTAFVLDDDPSQWSEEVRGSMDVIIDYQFPAKFDDMKTAMARKSRLVCCTPGSWSAQEERSLWTDLHQFAECLLLSSIKRATLFNFQESYRTKKYELKEDLQFLFTALTRRHIRPQIDRYVMLTDVPEVYRELQTRLPTGSIVCEPWRE